MPDAHFIGAATALALILTGCASVTDGTVQPTGGGAADAPSDTDASSNGEQAFRVDVWADNWFSVSVNGERVGEDSVSITTERSFNAESFTFDARYPLTVAFVAKDFKEDDTGLEYIGTDRQQMGDGGIIFQIVDLATGDVIAASDGAWQVLVTHAAPLDKSCEKSGNPTVDCEFSTTATPADWDQRGFDTSGWDAATLWSEGAVGPKDGYDKISWDASANLIWGGDLETDNTILLVAQIAAP